VAEDERRGEGEELFEDLDKFFAPIQDVDWPEPSKPSPAGASPDRERDEPEAEEPDRPEPAEVPRSAPAEIEEAESARAATKAFESSTSRERTEVGEVGQADPQASWSSGDAGSTGTRDAAEDDPEEEEGGVGSFLFETEAEDYEALAEQTDPERRAEPGYVTLPEPDEEGVVEVAELEEGEGGPVDEAELEPVEEAPDLEAVEAAADHFAESVRDEVRIDTEESTPEPEPTEEVAIRALLGEEGSLEDAEPATVRVGAEGFGGPSWQEPTAIEVGTEPEHKTGRDLPTAFLTGLILVGLAVGAILLGPGPFAILAGIVVLFALGEFYLAMQKRHYQPATALGLVSGALVLGAGYYRGENAMLAIMALSIFATFLWYMTVPASHRRNLVANISITVLGVAYIPLLAAYALAVLKLPDGEGLTLSIIGLTFVYDTAAFAVGFFWGSRPLAPNISPKKSWEGAIGATLVVTAVAVGVVAPSVTLLDTVGRSVGLAVVVALFAPLGDLAESLIKRDLGIKDMGGILPGHGGVMDRIDSVLFVAPAAFIYLRLILL